MSGLSTAYWIRQYDPKLKVVVIDARGVSSGATGRNGKGIKRRNLTLFQFHTVD